MRGSPMMRSVESPDGSAADLTPRQRKIIQVIEDSTQRYGYAPTLREIGEASGLASPSSVSHQLAALEKKGYLSRGSGRPRTAVVHPSRRPQAHRPATPASGAVLPYQPPDGHEGVPPHGPAGSEEALPGRWPGSPGETQPVGS